MKIIPAEKQHFELLQKFIEPCEYTCVQLASYVRKQSENLFILVNKDSLEELQMQQIRGVFSLNRTLHHCFPDLTAEEKEAAKPVFIEFFKNKTIKCIDGEKEITEYFNSILNQERETLQVNNYCLLVMNEEPLPPPENLSLDDEVKRCTEDDYDTLFEIQKMYICKEVAPQGKTVTDAEVGIALRQILKNQLCFALFSDMELVAKANSNAIGWKWIQIGGVYTHPLYRRNYYAWNLVYTICKRVMKTSRKVCLFVKEKNHPARALYNRMGFTETGAFEIVYYN